MKLSKKFIEDLHKIGQDAFIEKNQWIGKLVPEIIVDNLQKRGINQGDLEGVVCLSVEEACEILDYLGYLHLCGGRDSFLKDLEKCNRNLYERIEKVERCE